MKKQILTLAILATLPLTAMADDPIGPAAVPANETPVVATSDAPYQTVTVGNDDKSHIASTAYVKGAYNDTIAAINKVADDVNTVADDLSSQVASVINDSDTLIKGYLGTSKIYIDSRLSTRYNTLYTTWGDDSRTQKKYTEQEEYFDGDRGRYWFNEWNNMWEMPSPYTR